MSPELQVKPVIWIGSSRKDLRAFPSAVQNLIGYALFVAQLGGVHEDAKPLTGFGGAGVLEIVEDHRGDAFRAVYTLRYAGAVYVLHVFQKKSKRGRATPKREIDLVKRRLKQAEQIAKEREG